MADSLIRATAVWPPPTGYLNVSEMFTKLLTLSALFVSACCLSIGTVSEKNVTKRESNAGDLFPDWVPFKNKHGEELGEFVQVKKNKVKKRLAPPMNFLLRAVADPESEDYYDKGQGGENDAEDYFEKKDWSDVNRPAEAIEKKPIVVNHTDISDIDGVVHILTKKQKSPDLDAIYDANLKKTKEIKTKTEPNPDLDSKPEPVLTEGESEISVTESSSTTKAPVFRATAGPEPIAEKQKEKKSYVNNEEEDEENEEEPQQKPNKSPEEDKESEARKAKILSGVDELKERHAEEQRELTEKNHGEDLFKNEFGNEQTSDETSDRFSEKSSEESTVRPERYRKLRRKKPTTKPDYDEYEELDKSLGNKYKINVLKHETDLTTTTESTKRRKLRTDNPRKKNVHFESGKVSVFRNPQLFMVNDDSEETTIDPIKQNIRGPRKFSSKYTTITPVSSDERISLVPVESKEGEPTLFFPKPRRSKKKKLRTSSPAYDSTVAETVTDNYKQTTAYDVTAPEPVANSTEILSAETSAVGDTETTGTDNVSTKTAPVTDAIPAPSDHKKEHHKHEDYHSEKGKCLLYISKYMLKRSTKGT